MKDHNCNLGTDTYRKRAGGRDCWVMLYQLLNNKGTEVHYREYHLMHIFIFFILLKHKKINHDVCSCIYHVILCVYDCCPDIFQISALLDILHGSWFDNFLINCRYVVDAADRDSVPIAKSELHDLLTKQSLAGIPLLVLGNKIDKSEALSKQALVDQLWAQSSSFAHSSFYFLHDISAEAHFLFYFQWIGIDKGSWSLLLHDLL